MKVSRIHVAFGSTLNVGNYSNIRVEVSADADLEEGEDCGWVRNVAMGAPEGPIRQLYAHAAEEHPADLAAREEEPPARFEIAPERSVADLIREGLIVPASEFAP